MHAAKCCCPWCADSRCRRRRAACIFMNERHGPLLVLATARRDAARFQITSGRLVNIADNLWVSVLENTNFYLVQFSQLISLQH